MYILWSNRFSFVPWFRSLSRIGIGVVGIAVAFLGFVLIAVCDSPRHLTGTAHVPSWDFRKIEKGLLALGEVSRENAPAVLSGLAVRAKNTRPDILYNLSIPQMLLEVDGSSGSRAVASGEELFLQWEPSYAAGKMTNGPPAPLNWSKEKSGLTVTPFVFSDAKDADAVFFTVSLPDEGSEQAQEIPFLIESVQESSRIEQDASWLESLRLAQFWTKDLFLELYATTDANVRGNSYKIAIGTKEGKQILQARDGDYLVYQEGTWVNAPLEMAAEKPLAQILMQDQGQLLLRVWDSTGFMRRTISLSPVNSAGITSKVESDFLSPRLRNSAEVSCLLGQRRIVLKPGDWWLKAENRGWRNLKKMSDIDDFLAYKSEGEIFVVDTLEKLQGRNILKGRLFDKTRQVAQPVSLPIAEGRTGRTIKRHCNGERKKMAHESARRAPISLSKETAQRGKEDPKK